MWPVEEVGNDDELYVRVHKEKVNPKTKLPRPSAFKNTPEQGNDLSSDWQKYHTPQQSRELIGRQYRTGTTNYKDPNDFFITRLINRQIYEIECGQSTLHTPKYTNPEVIGDPNNRSHVGIFGDKGDKSNEEIRLKFVGISAWAIAP